MEEKLKSRSWGRFEIVSLIGKGGVGNVYKAYDPNLKRHIALKILRNEDPEVVQRFLREARAQAQVEHSHVCKIYESGEHEGHPYIAMQYIDGQNLRDLRDKLSLEAKIKIIQEVALGLHAAHRQGLIHRDVKPANIMIVQGDEGGWKPYIMDFGLAREQEAPGLTSTGMVVGTPYYMSPEHAKGKLKSLDRRSDIYSLGVTLYEILSGNIPFDGDTPVDILMKVIQKDPLPLRKVNPRIPVDIDTIVMKCLEKEPQRRYGSAKELAEDLDRYLGGDPIDARPASITYRVRRKLLKHKWPTILVAAASIVILVLIGLWLKTKWSASQRAVIAQELGQQVEKIESTLDYAHLLPIHNISREKNKVREQIRAIETKMEKLGELGAGPGHYALGRGYLALQDYVKANDHLEKAWNAGYQTAEVAYKRGLSLGELYLRESEKAVRIHDTEMREARKKEIEKTYRQPAVHFLREGTPSQMEFPEYIEALIGFYEKKYDLALKILLEAITKNQDDIPKLYKAKILEGNIFLAVGSEKKNYEEAMDILSKAENAYQTVIEIGKSDIQGYVGSGRVLELKTTMMLHSKGGDLQTTVEKAISFCDKALKIDPAAADVLVMKSSIYSSLGRYKIFTGKDPGPVFEQAAAAAGEAIKIDRENFEAYTMIGIIDRLKGEYQLDHGENPIPTFQAAAANFKKAIEIDPTYVKAHNGMGDIYVRTAQYEMSHGKNPRQALAQAISYYEQALAINPDLVNLYNGLAGALWFQGGAMTARGEDPRPAFLKAVQNLEKAIAINPSFFHFYSNVGFVLMDIGRYELDYGFAPIAAVNKAIAYFEKAVKINPQGNELYLGLVSVTGILTKYDYIMGKDCRQRTAEAAAYFKRGLEVNPNDTSLYIRMAENHIILAHYQVERRQSPLAALRQVDELLHKAQILNPQYYEIYTREGESALLKARWQSIAGQDAAAYFRAAQAALARAAALNPGDIYTLLTTARLGWWKAEWEARRGLHTAAAADLDNGLLALQNALTINPNYAETHALKGILLHLQAESESDETKRLAAQVEARVALLKGMGLNKNLQGLYAPYLQKKK